MCHTCHGSGAAPGTQPEVCPDCGGVGQISVNQGFFQLAQTCPHCTGHRPDRQDAVPDVQGDRRRAADADREGEDPRRRQGRRADQDRAARASPARPGSSRRRPVRARARGAAPAVRAQGRRPDARAAGVVSARRRSARTCRCPTLNGPVTLKVPAGTPTGKTFRVRGKGAPKRSGHGDLLVTVNVDVPTKLSKREKELLRGARAGRADGLAAGRPGRVVMADRATERCDARTRRRARGLRDQRGRRARRRAPADPADLRAEGPAAARTGPRATPGATPSATSSCCGRSRTSRRSAGSTSPA